MNASPTKTQLILTSLSPIAKLTTITKSNNRQSQKKRKNNAALAKNEAYKAQLKSIIPDENNPSLTLKLELRPKIVATQQSFYTKRDLPQF